MRYELQKLDDGQVCILVSILEKDLDEMWNRFDSGMCDLTTGNAVAIAINRTLRLETPMRVVSDGNRDEFHCVFNKEVFSLPSGISVWLNRCLRGMREKPICFPLWLPGTVAAEIREFLSPAGDSKGSIAA